MPKPISRLPALEEPPKDPVLAGIFAKISIHAGKLLNIHRVSGHAPKLFSGTAVYTAALRNDTTLPAALRELVILRTSQITESPYEGSVHRSVARKHGVPQAKIDALASWRQSSLFDETERTILAYVDQTVPKGDVDDATFAAIAKLYSPREIIELTAIIAWYTGNARFAKALRIVPEDESPAA